MAATLTSANELTFISFPITKFESVNPDDPNSDLYVYGKATDGSVDSDEQIVDTNFSSKAIADWLASGANVRVQHNAQRDPAGVGVEVNTDSDGTTWVKSLVVEPVAKTLVQKKALRAYSVGIARPKIVRDSVARGGRIVDGEIVEISLVDRPANKNCGIELVKADKDGNVEWVGKMFGNSDLLTKSASAEEIVLPANATFSPADLAKLLAHREIAEKRQMDPSVGGGVDRDKIPSSDFAGRDRSFPIVTPGDVSDAASSIGRAGAGNYSSDQLRANITRIAHHKGPQFVAALPESWQKGDDVTDVEKGEGASMSDEAEKPMDVKAAEMDDEGDGSEAKPDATKGDAKGGKTCSKCNKGFDADSKLRTCPNCGHKLPQAGPPSSEKGDDSVGDDEADVTKSDKCPSCGHAVGASMKFCGECGHKLGSVDKSHSPTPGDGVAGAGAADVESVPAHREPDGTAVEALESDAHMPTTSDASTPDDSVKAAQRLKSIGVPFELGTLHDLTCPAFDRAEVAKAYPADTLHTLDVNVWQQKALDAAANSPLDEAQRMTQLWQHVVTLKGADLETLDAIRDETHKSFADANPGPGSFPTPMELSPVRFRRLLITDGHAEESPDHDGPNTAKVPTDHITAADFNRGPLTGDHAAQSPSNKGRAFYRNVHRDAARQAMIALHDHISMTFPDICTVHENTGGPGTDPNPLPNPVGKSADAPVEPVVNPITEPVAKVKKSKKDKGMLLKAATLDAELIKSAVVDALTPLATQVEMLTKALDEERVKNAKLAETVDELSNLPDPTVTAFKGVASPDALKSSTPVVSTVASAAERTQAALMAALNEQARHSPDPGEREAAWSKLYQMNGIQ